MLSLGRYWKILSMKAINKEASGLKNGAQFRKNKKEFQDATDRNQKITTENHLLQQPAYIRAGQKF